VLVDRLADANRRRVAVLRTRADGVEVIRTEDRNFPERKHRVRRALARVRRWWPPWRRSKAVHVTRTVELSGTSSGGSTTTGEVTVGIDPNDAIARLDELEQRVTRLHAEQQAALDAQRARADKSANLLGQRIANLANDVYGAREQDRSALQESLLWQKRYTGVFIFGTVLATVGSVYA
jgi:hypothetical protein